MSNNFTVGDLMKKTLTKEMLLIDFMKQQFPDSSTNKLRKMLSSGRVKINNLITHKAKSQLKLGDIFELANKPHDTQKPQTKIKTKHSSIDLIYEDETIIVVEKPAKLLSIATDKLEQETLHAKCVDYLRQFNSRAWAYIVHRLDKETSGIMVLAKNKSAKDYLQEQFSQRSVYRIYHALVEGHVGQDNGTIEQYLIEDKHLNIKTTSSSDKYGKHAITHWEIMESYNSTTLVRVMIETGRRHQIRMAMKALGHPVVGDILHGAETNPHSRICLHATSLEFLHPQNDEPVRFVSNHPFTLS